MNTIRFLGLGAAEIPEMRPLIQQFLIDYKAVMSRESKSAPARLRRRITYYGRATYYSPIPYRHRKPVAVKQDFRDAYVRGLKILLERIEPAAKPGVFYFYLRGQPDNILITIDGKWVLPFRPTGPLVGQWRIPIGDGDPPAMIRPGRHTIAGRARVYTSATDEVIIPADRDFHHSISLKFIPREQRVDPHTGLPTKAALRPSPTRIAVAPTVIRAPVMRRVERPTTVAKPTAPPRITVAPPPERRVEPPPARVPEPTRWPLPQLTPTAPAPRVVPPPPARRVELPILPELTRIAPAPAPTRRAGKPLPMLPPL